MFRIALIISVYTKIIYFPHCYGAIHKLHETIFPILDPPPPKIEALHKRHTSVQVRHHDSKQGKTKSLVTF